MEWVDILGVRVHTLSVDQLVRWIVRAVAEDQRAIVTNVNVHALNIAHDQPWFADFLRRSDITFCDGFGVKWGAKLLGAEIPHRYTPPDWIDDLSTACAADDISIYLLGAKPGVAERAAAELRARHPGLHIAGTHHGYFDHRKGSAECDGVVAAINDAGPDILLVGFGMPLQERWIDENWSRLDARVALPVGALIDYVAGEVVRGPQWLTDHGFEWLSRLIIEPRRLAGRYLIGNPRFLLRVIKARLS